MVTCGKSHGSRMMAVQITHDAPYHKEVQDLLKQRRRHCSQPPVFALRRRGWECWRGLGRGNPTSPERGAWKPFVMLEGWKVPRQRAAALAHYTALVLRQQNVHEPGFSIEPVGREGLQALGLDFPNPKVSASNPQPFNLNPNRVPVKTCWACCARRRNGISECFATSENLTGARPLGGVWAKPLRCSEVSSIEG